MHIEIELDDTHGEKLASLQRSWQKPLPEALATLIDWAAAQKAPTFDILPEPMSIEVWQEFDLSRENLYGDDGR
jgi:hypothetical protein